MVTSESVQIWFVRRGPSSIVSSARRSNSSSEPAAIDVAEVGHHPRLARVDGQPWHERKPEERQPGQHSSGRGGEEHQREHAELGELDVA